MGCKSWGTRAVVIFWCISLSLIHVSLSENIKPFHWEVEYIFGSPDGVERVVMGINGEFPGPTIRAKVGDTIIVNVTNKLHTEGVVIHWHGITQRGTPWADGTASISQCPINPGETFEYRFKVDKAGTYFYHGHYGMQRSSGLYGSLIVDVADGKGEPFDHYDGELNLLLSDWWHKSVHEQEVGLSSKEMRWINEPQTLLINGRGQFNCSLAAKVASNFGIKVCEFPGKEQFKHESFQVATNKIYRVRIASTTALASLNVAIEDHKMTVIEADGNYVDPVEVENLDIHSGESYSVLIKTYTSDSKNYWISVGVRGRKPETPPALAILNYSGKSELPTSDPPETPDWEDFEGMKQFSKKINAREGVPKPSGTHHRRLILLNTQNYINGFTKWSINNVSLVLPPTPYLGSIKFGLNHAFDQRPPPDNYDIDNYDIRKTPENTSIHGNGIYNFDFGTTVDMILQNAKMLKKDVSEIHPWHLHGHDFWVLGYGEGKFKEVDEKDFNLKNPPFRNTAVLFPYGWTALRFVANNPGVWAFHCHIEPHLHMGMGVVFAEGVHLVGEIPKAALACGLTGSLQQPNIPLTPAPDSTPESLGPAPAPASGLSASLQVPNLLNSILIAIVLSLYLSFF